MPITATDIEFRLSTNSGAAGDSTAQADPNDSLGKYVSTTQLSGTALNNLFDDVSGAENAASDVEYRCIFILNQHNTLTLQSAKVWLSAETGGGANIAIATDNVGITAKGSASAQSEEETDEGTAPTNVSAFSSPTTFATGLSLGSIGPDQVAAIWVRRSATNSAALDNDGVTISVQGDTAA